VNNKILEGSLSVFVEQNIMFPGHMSFVLPMNNILECFYVPKLEILEIGHS